MKTLEALVTALTLAIALLTGCGSGPTAAEPTATPSPRLTPTSTATRGPERQTGWTAFTAADGVVAYEDLQAIAVAPDGTLWLGSNMGIYALQGSTWMTHTALGRGISVNVLSLAVGPAGGIWAGTREGLTRFDGSTELTTGGQTWTPYPRRDYCDQAYCPEIKWGFSIAVAPDGALWLADGWQLHRFDGTRWTEHKPHPFDDERIEGMETLALSPNGDVWLGAEGGVYHLADQTLALTGEFEGWRYYEDGAYHLLEQTATRYTVADGLPSNHVEAIAISSDGTVWLGTDQGAARFDGSTELTTAGQTWQTITSASVKDIAVGPQGALWFLTEAGIARYGPEEPVVAQQPPTPIFTPIPTRTPTVTPIPTETPIPPTATPTPTPLPEIFRPVATVAEILPGEFRRLHVGSEGTLWLATDRGAAEYVNGTWHVHLTDAPGEVVAIDDAGRVWVIHEESGDIAAWDGAAWTTYGEDDGWAPLEAYWYQERYWGQSDRQGHLWLVTLEDVRRFEGTRWTVFTAEEMGMGPPKHEGLMTDFHVTALENSDQVWVGTCDWGGPGPLGGRGARWFDGSTELTTGGQTWQGVDSPVASGCTEAIEEDAEGRIWLSLWATVWRHDPATGDWAQFTPPEDPPGEGQRYGAVLDLALDSTGDPWVRMLFCGGACCEAEALYHLQDEEWIQVGEIGMYGGTLIDIDGTLWLFGNGIYRVKGTALEPVVPLLVHSTVVDEAGRVWFVAWHRGTDWLWTLAAQKE